MLAGRVEVEQLGQRHVLGHALLLPALQAVVAELALDERDARRERVGVAQMACGIGHAVTRQQRVDAILKGGLISRSHWAPLL